MRVGRGFVGPMSNSYIKRLTRGRSLFLYSAACIALGLILTGCGDISLNQLLENQEPGELSISPTDAYIPASGTLDISGKGGFKPYMYQNKGTLGSVDPQTGEYTAPFSVAGDYETTDIEVSDSFGTTASTTITVFRPIELSPVAKTIRAGDTVIFVANGGVPHTSEGYYFSINGSVPESDDDGIWETDPFTAGGVYTVEVADSLGNTAISTITADGSMAIDAEQNWVVQGTGPYSSTILTAINQTSPHIFSTEPLGPPSEVGWLFVDSFSPYFPYTYDETAIYHAPDSEAVVTIQLTDWVGNIATVDIHVLSAPPEPLVFPTAVTVLIDEVVQLTASGGIEPHTFSLVGAGALSPHPVQEYRIRYHAPDFPTTALICVEDALGRQAKVTVYVVEGG
jgi:plastocyanin